PRETAAPSRGIGPAQVGPQIDFASSRPEKDAQEVVPTPPRPFGKVCDGRDKDPAGTPGRITSPARYPGGPGGTPGVGEQIPGGGRPASSREHVDHHLPPGPRAGARTHRRVTPILKKEIP